MILTYSAEVYRRYKQRQQMLDWFEPLPYQSEAYLCTKPVQLIEGGNRSGKTHLACAKLVMIALGKHPTIKRLLPVKARIIANVLMEGALGIILNKLKDLVPLTALEGGRWDKAFKVLEKVIRLRNGSTIQLMANTQDLQTHRGEDLDIAMIDEECNEEVFDETLMRLSDRAGMLFFSMTPHNGMTWSYKKLVKASRKNPTIGYFHLDTLSNYKIQRKELIVKSALFDDKQFAIRIKGDRVANEGLVYFMFDERTHVTQPFELPTGTQLFLGVDFGINNPHAGWLQAITPEGKKFLIDEYYETGKTVSQNGEAQGEWIKKRWGNYKLRWVACDPMSGAQRNEQTNETNMEVYRKSFCKGYGKTVPVLAGDRQKGSVEHRIDKMREQLVLGPSGMPELLIFSNCINSLNEFEEYVWTTRKGENMNSFERPKDSNNHLMNAGEYVAERNPKYMRGMGMERVELPRLQLQYGHIGR